MNGTYSQKSISRPFPTDWTLRWWEALLLIGGLLGAMIILGIQRYSKKTYQ